MNELLVIGYRDAATAEAARESLFELSREYYADVGDAVVATADDKGRIRLNQMVTPWVVTTASGSLWGALIGLIFLHPLLGLVAGAAAGAVSGALSDFGIRDDFMKDVARVLKPGQAALFVMARSVNTDRIVEHLGKHGGEVLRTNLSHAGEERLRKAFEAAQQHADSA